VEKRKSLSGEVKTQPGHQTIRQKFDLDRPASRTRVSNRALSQRTNGLDAKPEVPTAVLSPGMLRCAVCYKLVDVKPRKHQALCFVEMSANFTRLQDFESQKIILYKLFWSEEFCLLRYNTVQSIGVDREFGRTCRFHLQSCSVSRARNNQQAKPIPCFVLVSCLFYFATLKTDATCSSETSVDFQRTTWRSTPEDISLYDHRSENLRS
jgi:hypothetical protein